MGSLPAQARSRGCLTRSGLGGASFSRSLLPCRKPSHFLCLGGGDVGVGDGGAHDRDPRGPDVRRGQLILRGPAAWPG